MNWKKTLLFISTAIGTTTLAFHVINKFIFNASDEHSEEDESNYYNWKFGNIYYKKEGTGSPVLLIHDLNHYSSSMEWDKVIGTLSKEHTVYTIDLLGCGKSDKPAITYTCYLYVQLLTDFIRDIIGEKTDIVATGASASFVTAACQNIADQIDHIILVCPESTHALAKAPNHKSKLLAKIINIPIYGTFIYNVGARNTALSDSAECKYLYASILGHYTTVNVAHCLEGLTTSIAVITGKNAPETSQKATEYCHILPSIDHLLQEHINTILRQVTIAQTTDVHTRTGTHMLHIAQVADIVICIFYRLLLRGICQFFSSTLFIQVFIFRHKFLRVILILFYTNSCYLLDFLNIAVAALVKDWV